MPTRGVFVITGQVNLNAQPFDYSDSNTGSTFLEANYGGTAVGSTKSFNDIRVDSSIGKQWVAVGSLGVTGLPGPSDTSKIFYSNDAYNWFESQYTGTIPTTSDGTIYCVDYGTIDDASTKGWLTIGNIGQNPTTNTYSITFTTPTGNNASFIEYDIQTNNLVDMTNSDYQELKGDGTTNWLLSFNDNTVGSAPLYTSYVYSINTNFATPSLYAYNNIFPTILGNIAIGPFSGITNAGFPGIDYATVSANPVWGLAGSASQTGPNIGIVVFGSPSTTWAISKAQNFQSRYQSIATNGAGTWVAVGDINPGTGQVGLISYTLNNGITWQTDVTISAVSTFSDIATDKFGNWVAIGNSSPGTGNQPVAYYSSNLVTWTQSTVPVANNLAQFTTIAAGVDDVPCFLKGTLIRTLSGEVTIETLKEGDEVVTTTGEVKAITNIQRATVPPTESTNPYKIPEGDLGATQDLYLSPTHGVRTAGGETVEAQFLGYVQEQMDVPVEYYNISIGRLRSELIYANGVAVESMGADGKNVVADVSTFSQERIFTEEIRNDLIDKLNKKMKISYDKLVSYPDSYLQELLSR